MILVLLVCWCKNEIQWAGFIAFASKMNVKNSIQGYKIYFHNKIHTIAMMVRNLIDKFVS